MCYKRNVHIYSQQSVLIENDIGMLKMPWLKIAIFCFMKNISCYILLHHVIVLHRVKYFDKLSFAGNIYMYIYAYNDSILIPKWLFPIFLVFFFLRNSWKLYIFFNTHIKNPQLCMLYEQTYAHITRPASTKTQDFKMQMLLYINFSSLSYLDYKWE